MAATASAALCPAAVLTGARIPSPVVDTARATVRFFSPPRLYSSSKLLHLDSQSQDVCRFFSLRARASSDESSSSADDVLADLKAKWDSLENKSTVLLYGGGALVAVWLSSVVVGAINSVPLLPKVLELVGLGYTGWFVYRYLLFKESRKELASDIEDLKKKIAGSSE
ncbi:protein CURVATURE THYLAKOID 1A, chloroplastic-like [Zingiber officinale]|uniref:protein CURVATURE THYLAKOID 1A, chloroplastic-like n=1 Tax=Zingiber officinale TaxID=94328 RepID=UPI001C4D37C3|nr:protein CURVATURE THYLAKOID 1A, chloroplastic-like [Zingiber officinale]